MLDFTSYFGLIYSLINGRLKTICFYSWKTPGRRNIVVYSQNIWSMLIFCINIVEKSYFSRFGLVYNINSAYTKPFIKKSKVILWLSREEILNDFFFQLRKIIYFRSVVPKQRNRNEHLFSMFSVILYDYTIFYCSVWRRFGASSF